MYLLSTFEYNLNDIRKEQCSCEETYGLPLDKPARQVLRGSCRLATSRHDTAGRYSHIHSCAPFTAAAEFHRLISRLASVAFFCQFFNARTSSNSFYFLSPETASLQKKSAFRRAKKATAWSGT